MNRTAPSCIGSVYPALLATILATACSTRMAEPAHPEGRQFLSFTDFTEFRAVDAGADRVQFLSPVLTARVEWDELILSWNVATGFAGLVQFEVAPVLRDETERWYSLGRWSRDGHGRTSLNGQKDPIGAVWTDTLHLAAPTRQLRIRFTWDAATSADTPPLDFLGVSLLNTAHPPVDRLSSHRAWGLKLDVPTRCQLDYEGGDSWCSPTAVQMVLSYLAKEYPVDWNPPDVPTVARAVHDPGWRGTGNWSFNTAYAGSLPGMRAYVTRLADVTELEQWLQGGIPVAVSVSYSLLKDQPNQNDGHFVVLVGFTDDGNVMVNDPGSRLQPRRVVQRDVFIRAWAHSHNTVYLIHPEDAAIPPNRRGHWAG